MAELTNWDDYSDMSEDSDNDTLNVVNENTKLFLVKKYASFVKGAIEVS
jgi:hypothetical protein